MSVRSLAATLLAVVLCCSQDAHAGPTEAALAKLHVSEGQAAFDAGRFAEAADDFETAFVYKKLPAILFNAAQARRLAKQTDKAIALYRDFMDLFPVDPRYPEAKAQLQNLERTPGAFSDLPVVQPPAAQVDAENETPAPEPSRPILLTNPRLHEEKPRDVPKGAPTPIYEKAWFWGAVGGGAVVLITTITLAVVLTRPTPAWTSQPDIGPGASSALSVRW